MLQPHNMQTLVMPEMLCYQGTQIAIWCSVKCFISVVDEASIHMNLHIPDIISYHMPKLEIDLVLWSAP